MIKFLITGSARSGTGYFSTIMNRIGLKTGHENIFHPWTNVDDIDYSDYAGESSWLAANSLHAVPTNVLLIHLTRHPAKVIQSHLELEFFHDDGPAHHQPYLHIARSLMPEYADLSPQQRAEIYWYRWNEHIESYIPRFNISIRVKLEEINVGFIQHVLALINRKDLSGHVEKVLKNTPLNVNNKARSKPVKYGVPAIKVQNCAKVMRSCGYK